MGGPGVFPEIHPEAALQPRHIMGSVAPAYEPSPEPAERHRRTIYAFRLRTLPDPLLDVFNRPGADVSCERRDETTIAPQALALLNGGFARDRALALAARLERSASGLPARVKLAFGLLYGRAPGNRESEECAAHVEAMIEHHRERPPIEVEPARRVTRRMVEELTGEEFTWEEELRGMEEFKPDLKPWQAGPETRGLAELCLVLFNSNEFLHVR